MSNTLYNYTVQAFDFANNVSPLSQALYLQTNRTTASSATGLVATAVSPKEINLSWSAPSDSTGLGKYLVYSGTTPSNLQQIVTAPSTVTTYKNLSLAPATTYYYGIVAVEEGIDAPMSTLASATTFPLPPPPSDVAATPGAVSVALTWQDSAQPGGLPIGTYQIYEGTVPGNLTKVGTVTSAAYTAKSLSPSTTYYFEIVAVDTSYDDSVPSDQISVTTHALPAAPVDVVATVKSDANVTVTWTENVPTGGLPIKFYYIFRGATPTTLANVATRTTAEYVDTTVSPGATYYYAVEALDTSLDVSPQSAPPVSATTPVVPAAPVNVIATADSSTKVTVTWSENVPTGGLPIKYYYIFRGTSPTTMTNVATRTTAEYIDTTVTAGTTYYYAVEALDTDLDVSPQSSPPASVTP